MSPAWGQDGGFNVLVAGVDGGEELVGLDSGIMAARRVRRAMKRGGRRSRRRGMHSASKSGRHSLGGPGRERRACGSR